MSEGAPAVRGLERLELRMERLQLTIRFTFAFHAREVRFECDRGDGWERVFPETFSFRVDHHDPAELFLQLDDLMTKPQLISPNAHRRDASELVSRLLAAAPRYLERVRDVLEAEGRVTGDMRVRFYQDLGLLAQILLRFGSTRELDERRPVRVAGHLLTKLMFVSMQVLLAARVEPEYLERYARGEVDPVDPSDDATESGFHHILEGGKPEVVNRIVVRMAERAFYLWLEGVCLNTENTAFEKEDSPFADRETEILRAVLADGRERLERGGDFRVFLQSPTRDCDRLLGRLEAWFLRCYDIRHSSAIIYHRAHGRRHEDDRDRVLTWHSPRNYLFTLGVLSSPYIAAAFAYDRAPVLLDLLCSLEVVVVNAAAAWFLAWKFCWKKDLTLFHAAVPRIGAGIIVGFLPVFLIDEVWGLAGRDPFTLIAVVSVLGLATLLYIYVEVQGRLPDSRVAFARARGIFLLGILEAAALGVVMTSLIGRFMVSRNWSPDVAGAPIESIRVTLDPLVGQLPQIVGFAPFYAFPAAVVMMTFISFFIGIFLQLMWEELPITEPL